MVGRYRTMIFEDESAIRDLIEMSAKLRNHEVLSFAYPCACFSKESICPCASDNVCTDFLITDHMMPGMTGLELIEKLENMKCPIPHKALITASQADAVLRRAEALGCKVITKPFQLSDINSWHETSEKEINHNRKLLSKDKVMACAVSKT